MAADQAALNNPATYPEPPPYRRGIDAATLEPDAQLLRTGNNAHTFAENLPDDPKFMRTNPIAVYSVVVKFINTKGDALLEGSDPGEVAERVRRLREPLEAALGARNMKNFYHHVYPMLMRKAKNLSTPTFFNVFHKTSADATAAPDINIDAVRPHLADHVNANMKKIGVKLTDPRVKSDPRIPGNILRIADHPFATPLQREFDFTAPIFDIANHPYFGPGSNWNTPPTGRNTLPGYMVTGNYNLQDGGHWYHDPVLHIDYSKLHRGSPVLFSLRGYITANEGRPNGPNLHVKPYCATGPVPEGGAEHPNTVWLTPDFMYNLYNLKAYKLSASIEPLDMQPCGYVVQVMGNTPPRFNAAPHGGFMNTGPLKDHGHYGATVVPTAPEDPWGFEYICRRANPEFTGFEERTWTTEIRTPGAKHACICAKCMHPSLVTNDMKPSGMFGVVVSFNVSTRP